MTAKETGSLCGGGGRIKILWNYLVMMVAQLNEYTETRRIIRFNIMNFMLNELYLFFSLGESSRVGFNLKAVRPKALMTTF